MTNSSPADSVTFCAVSVHVMLGFTAHKSSFNHRYTKPNSANIFKPEQTKTSLGELINKHNPTQQETQNATYAYVESCTLQPPEIKQY